LEVEVKDEEEEVVALMAKCIVDAKSIKQINPQRV
jgi:hypothetical protein